MLTWNFSAKTGEVTLVGYSPQGHKRVRHNLETKKNYQLTLLYSRN